MDKIIFKLSKIKRINDIMVMVIIKVIINKKKKKKKKKKIKAIC